MKLCFCCGCCCYCCCCCCCCPCFCWSHKPFFKVWFKSGQEQLRYRLHWVCGGGGVKSFSRQTRLLSWVVVVTICIQNPQLQASNKNVLKPSVQKSVLSKIGLYILGVGGIDYQEDTNHIIFRSTWYLAYLNFW